MAKALGELLWLVDMSGDAQGLLDNCEVTVDESVAENAAVASEAQLATAQHVTNIPPPPAAKL